MAITVPEARAADLRDVCRARVFFGHQSVGGNVLRGLGLVYAAAGEPAPRLIETRLPVAEPSFLAHTKVGKNRDPIAKLADFSEVIDGPLGDEVDVALLKFCYADITSSTDVPALNEAYHATLDALQQRHPGIRFIHATVPLTTDRGWKAKTKALLGRDDQRGPADNLARQHYNSMMRDAHAADGQLFDIAAVEATADQQPMTRRTKGQRYEVLNRALSSDAGHLNSLGSELAATELIRVIAAGATR